MAGIDKAILSRAHMLKALDIIEIVAQGRPIEPYTRVEAQEIAKILRPQLYTITAGRRF